MDSFLDDDAPEASEAADDVGTNGEARKEKKSTETSGLLFDQLE